MKMNQETAQDIFGTWQTITLVTTGLTFVLASLIGFNSVGIGFLSGITLIGAGFAYGIQRFFTEGENIALEQVQRQKQEQQKHEKNRIDLLWKQIKNNADDGYGKKSREILHDLITIKGSFENHVDDPDVVAFVTPSFQAKFRELFWYSISRLEQAAKLLKAASQMTNNQKILDARHKMIDEVEENLVSLTSSFEGLTTLGLTQNTGGLETLRLDLESKLNTAQAVERELGGFHSTIDQDYLN